MEHEGFRNQNQLLQPSSTPPPHLQLRWVLSAGRGSGSSDWGGVGRGIALSPGPWPRALKLRDPELTQWVEQGSADDP